jgi:selenocysteine lyase/cysteine desulfurase
MTYDVDRLRARIPALADGTAYFDGPGGTQTPDIVAEAVATAMTSGVSNRGRTTLAERHADDITMEARIAGADLVTQTPGGSSSAAA